MATAVYANHMSHMAAPSPSGSDSFQSPGEEQYFSTFFCRALYDYQTDDDSSLSFHQDDIIEVLTKLDSGWWDGLLGQERGWFPSNYVAILSDQETDALFAADAPEPPDPPDLSTSQYGSIDVTHNLSATSSQPSQNWETQYEQPLPTQENRNEPAVAPEPVTSSDFWVPQVSMDGRIYYMNTQTGQQSLDLPQEVDQDISDGELSGMAAQPNSRSAVLGLGTAAGPNGNQNGDQAGFGVSARTGTPEPWKKVLADDGMSYYFLNTLDGSVSWTLPSVDSAPDPSTFAQMEESILSMATSPSSDRDTIMAAPVPPQPQQRLRSDSAVSRPSDRGYTTDHYSDDSDVQPAARQRSESSTGTKRNGSSGGPAPLRMKPKQPQTIPELTSAEQSAQALQQALAPPRPESVNDLSTVARDSIITVVQYIQSHDVMSQPRYGQELNDRVLTVVSSVRNLLYISATPSGHIPSSLYSRDSRNPRPTPASQTLQAHLKPAQRKVAGTLSKLVLSTLAIQYDSGVSSADKPQRMEADALELERAIVAFVLEVHRFLNQNTQAADRASIKRLHAVFSPQNMGLGLLGGGAAAGWKGFGWMALDEMEDAPHRLLSVEVVSELKSHVSNIEAKRLQFTDASPDNVKPPDVLAKECQEFIRRLHACIGFVCNIHVARHVDIDGINVDNGPASNRDLYLQTVETAKRLVRTLESAVQVLYDDGAAFLLFAQTIRSDIAGSPIPSDSLRSLAVSLRQNLDSVTQTCEALLSVGHEQAELGQGDYNGSIEWRMSRISMVDSQFDGVLPVFAKNSHDDEDLVDMELAFQRPGSNGSRGPIDRGTIYRNPSQSSEASLEPVSEVFTESPGPMTATPTRFLDQSTTTLSSNSKSIDIPPPLDLDNEAAAMFDDEGPAAASKSPPRGAKLRKLLGDDAPQAYIDKVNADLKKWYLRPDYSSAELMTDPEGTVRGGTIQALVERLTTHDAPDTKYNKTFLMTYKSFTTTSELFELLVQRFWIQPPDNLEPHELEEWKKLKQHVVRARVLNTLKNMVVDDDILETEDAHIFQRIKEFASTEAVSGSAAAKQLMIHVERAQRGNDIKVTTVNPGSLPPPASIVPKSKSKLKIADIDPLEMARQLTLMESRLYTKIRPIECLQRSRDMKGDTSDNISSVIQFANRIANWVADSVLVKEDSRRRAGVVKNFINVADRCRVMHNFPSMVAIVAGLNTPPIRRLKRTWEQVPARFMTLLSTCETTMDTNKNFGNYRTILAQIIPPCVPFIGVFLTQLTFINENPNSIGPNLNLVNFRKRQKTAEVIQDIKRWQSVPYNFNPVQQVLGFVEESLSIFSDGQDLSDHFWNLSLEREPREREDEKMARLLQESGFL